MTRIEKFVEYGAPLAGLIPIPTLSSNSSVLYCFETKPYTVLSSELAVHENLY